MTSTIEKEPTNKSETNDQQSLLHDQDYDSYVRQLRETGRTLRSDRSQPQLLEKPLWFDEELYKNAKSVYERHFMGMNFAHLSGLLLLVRVDSIYQTLNLTGESASVSKLFRRYYNTVKHVKRWYEGDIFEENSEAHRSLLIVRGMHNSVSSRFNTQTGISKDRVHISEYDVMITQFAFVGFIITNANKVGLIGDFSQKDLNSLLHFWRLVGYYLGASDKYNLCSYDLNDIVGICKAMLEFEYKASMVKNSLKDPQGIMSVNIVRSVKFIPMLTIYGIMRHLYEILGQELNELESKRNWYSNLSYTLIKLVMTRLLAYKPFRSFNNGLTRLSLFLIGKMEDWFSNKLEAKYGQDLKL